MNIKDATQEQKLRALAELDGWTFNGDGLIKNPSPYGTPADHAVLWIHHPNVPKYLTSYDAIIPLIQKLTKDENIMIKFCAEICQDDDSAWFTDRLVKATPSQLCDAVLIATGKFEV